MKMHADGTLHVIAELSIGGAEKTLMRLLAADVTDGRRVMVVTALANGSAERELLALGIPVVSLSGSRAGSGTRIGLRATVEACSKFAPDVIVGWMYHGILLSHLIGLAVARSAPIIWNIRASIDDRPNWPWTSRMLTTALRSLSPLARAIVYNSEEGRRQHEAFGFDARRAQVIDNGFDLRLFAPDSAARSRIRAELGIGSDEFVIGHVARYSPVKAHEHLIRAVLSGPFCRPVCLVMAGRGVTERNLPPERIAGEGKRNSRVILLGERQDVALLMNGFDVLCLTSTSESFPNVVGEAMASGVPCVVTRVGDAARIVGDTGVTVDPGCRDAVRQALERVTGWSSDELAFRGSRARERIATGFSLERMVASYRALYRAVSNC